MRFELALACAGMCLSSCFKDKAKDTEEPRRPDAALLAAAPADEAARAPRPSASSRFARDSDGHLVPRTPRPVDDPADIPKAPTRELDWDLDKTDPARDYVDRYVRATLRYGDKMGCVKVMPSVSGSGARTVEVKDVAGQGCPAPGDAARDRFRVSVPDDRLHLDGKGQPLKKWPDGSDPEGPANAASVGKDEPDLNGWNGKAKAALQGAKLTPIRAQWYGRGSYPLITVAGWRAPVVRGATPEALKAVAETVCEASGGLPLGVVAGIDRSTVLRFSCPALTHWDAL